jgi:hypothetical protein
VRYPLCTTAACLPAALPQVDPRYGGRQLQRMVQKLAAHSWQLTYEGYSAALAARADEVAAGLRAWQQQHQTAAASAASVSHDFANDASVAPPGLTSPSPGAAATATAAAAAAAATVAASAQSGLGDMLPAAALADCAGGILSAVEAASGGQGAGEMLAPEPELLLAATRRGEQGGGSVHFQLRGRWRPGATVAAGAQRCPVVANMCC